MLSVVTAHMQRGNTHMPAAVSILGPGPGPCPGVPRSAQRRIMRQGVLPALGSRETSEPSHSEDGPVPVSVSPRPRRGT